MNIEDLFYAGGFVGILIFFAIAIWVILVLLIPFLLLGIYRQAQETNRVLGVIAKRIRTGEENAISEQLGHLLSHAEQRDGITFRSPAE